MIPYIISYDIVAMLIFSILLFFFGFRKRGMFVSIQYKIYYVILVLCLLSSVFDISAAILSNYVVNAPKFSLYIVNIALFSTLTLLCMFHTIYVYLVVNSDVTQMHIKKIHLIIPAAAMILFIVTTPFTKLLFYIDDKSIYHRGSLHIIFYFLLLYYFIHTFYVVYKYKASPQKRILLYVLTIVLMTSLVIQVFFPTLLINIFAISICVIFNVFTLLNPEELFDATTGAIQYGNFINIVKSRLISSRKFTVITVHVNDYAFLCNSFGAVQMDKILYLMVEYLNGLSVDSTVGKINSHTFGVLLDEKCNDKKIIAEIQKRFESPWHINDCKTIVSVSIGCILSPEDVTDIEEFYDAIDAIMKSQNKNGPVYVHDVTDVQKINKIRKAVHYAAENGTFKVYYQPIYSTDKKKIIAAEALIRLFDDELGFVSPELFIPIAESDGSILGIGRFVFENVCRFISEQKLYEKGIEYIEVNLSVVQCMQHQLAEELISIMKKYEIPPKYINFEITETAAIRSLDALTKNMSVLSSCGITFALDDYGTGYSNISYVYNLPFSCIKIDKSILWSAIDNPKAYITLKNTFSMIKQLRMQIVMEGVETEEQIQKLLELKCDYFQGFYFSKAIPEEDFVKYIDEFKLPEVCLNTR